MHPQAQRIKDAFGYVVSVETDEHGCVNVALTTRWFFETIDPQTKEALPEGLITAKADQVLRELQKLQEVFRG